MSAEISSPLDAEQRRERWSEIWLFVRALIIVLAIAGAFVAHQLH